MPATIVVNDIGVNLPDQALTNQYLREVANQSTTVKKITFGHPPKNLDINYMQGTGAAATGKLLYIVFNALSDTDAAFKLTIEGQRYILAIGDTQSFFYPQGVTRVDIVSAASEAGTSLTFIKAGSA